MCHTTRIKGVSFQGFYILGFFSLIWIHFAIHITLVNLVGLFQFSPHVPQIGMECTLCLNMC